MQKKGYIKLYRKIQDWEWFHDGNMLKTMIWLLVNANIKDSQYRGMPVRRGSLVVSLKEMSLSLSGNSKQEKVSLQQLRTILKRLQRTGEILLSSTNAYTLITICKYELYQGNSFIFENEATNEQQTSNKRATNEQHSSENIRIQEYNNILSHTCEEITISDEEYTKIKKRYNAEFDRIFHPCRRLSLNARIAIRQCLETFGRQSFDTAILQLRQSPWLTGSAPSGWRPDILWIFTPANYERIIEGYYTTKPRLPTSNATSSRQGFQIEIPSKEELQKEKQEKEAQERSRILRLVRLAEEDPTSHAHKVVMNMYSTGKLAEININWKPKNTTI